MKYTSFLALASVLALAACNQTTQTTDNAMVNADNALPADEANFNDEIPVIEDVSSTPTEAVTVAAVPPAPTAVPAAEAAPVVDAGAIEQEIRSGTGIQRIRYGDGWAWTRDGKILRTAGRDGRDVAYFRPGAAQPFFVQRDGRAWGYDNGRPTHEYDRDGRPRAPDAARQRDAEQAAREAREQRARAEEARQNAQRPGGDRDGRDGRNGRDDRDGRDGRDGRPDRPQASPTPTSTPSPSPTARGPRGNRGDRDWRRPQPSPSASPTGQWRRPDRRPDREPSGT